MTFVRSNEISPGESARTGAGVRKPKVLVTLAGGGFLWQSRSLIAGLGDGFDIHLVTPDNPQYYVQQGFAPSRLHRVRAITRMKEAAISRSVFKALLSLPDTYRVLRSVNPEAVICIATSLAVPLCFWAKLFGAKTIFVESITRTNKASRTGKLLSLLRLCDRLYVQWPEAERLYRGAIYRGTLL